MKKIFADRRVNERKLITYGFTKSGDAFEYSSRLPCGFDLHVRATMDGGVTSGLTDAATGDEYVLVHVESANGGFVGMVRAEYEAKLADIADKCFDGSIFGSLQAQEVIAYVKDRYGDELLRLWEKFPEDAVFRRRDNAKWYGVMMYLTDDKIGRSGDTYVDIIDLKATPATIASIDGKKILPAYHMNKNHWITICLDGSAETEEICRLIDESYMLAGKK